MILVQPPISGIMVDGISNLCGLFPEYDEGPDMPKLKETDKNTTMFDQQKYDKADMVVLGTASCDEFHKLRETINKKKFKIYGDDYKPSQEYFEFPLWAIYGSVVVEGSIHKGNIKELREHTKVVWANKKPYILNGEGLYHNA